MDNKMNNITLTLDRLDFSRVMDIPGLSFRGFHGEEDYPKMLKVIYGCKQADGLERGRESRGYRQHLYPPGSL